MTVMSIALSGLWTWAVHRRLLRGDEAHHMRVRATIPRFGACLVLYGALAVFYVFDQQRTGEPEAVAPGMTSGRD